MRVLIVDDDARLRAVIVQIVTGLGCEIRECDNGLAAVVILSESMALGHD